MLQFTFEESQSKFYFLTSAVTFISYFIYPTQVNFTLLFDIK